MKPLIKKYQNQLILIITTLLIVFISTRFTNMFGSNTDWINQHTVIPDYFRQIFYKTGNLLPNLAFNYGAGQNIYNYSYYGLLSPIILPSYLLPNISMTTYIIVTNIILVLASSLLFYRFLKNHSYSDTISLVTSLLFTLAAPLIFHMHRHIMFVNYMPFLIMALIGVDKYLEKKQSTLLIISIFLMIMTSYYYSVCGILVTGIYYLYKYLTINNKTNLLSFTKDIIKFIFIIFIPILLSAILLIPTIYTLLLGRGTSESHYSLLSLLTPNLKLHKTFCGTYGIGISIIGFISILYLFYTKKKNNIIIATIISIILFIPIFRYILNGGLYLREKCFIPFLPLISYFVAYFLNDLLNNKINIKNFTIYLTIIALIILPFNIKQYCYLIILLFIISLYLYQKLNNRYFITIPILLIALGICIGEALNEDDITIKEYNQIFNSQAESTIKEILNEDKSFYRSNNLDYPTKTVNKIYASNYYTTNLYSSTYNFDYLEFVRKGFINSNLDYNYFLFSATKNILFNTYMGVKYLYGSIDPGLGYEKIKDNLWKNTLAMPLIYSSSSITNKDEYHQYPYPYNLEILLQSVITDDETNTKIDNKIKKFPIKYTLISNEGVSIEKTDNTYILTVSESGNIQLKLDKPLKDTLLFINLDGLEENTCKIDNIELTINNVSNILTCKTWPYKNRNYTFHYLLNDKTIDTLDIKLKKGTYKITNIESYTLDYNELTKYSNNISAMDITNIKNNTITGTITTKEDGYLVTTIPYDKGFTVTIDGQEEKILKLNEAFLGTKLTKGYHKVTIKYRSPGLNIGITISIIGIIIFITNLIYEKIKEYKKYEKNKGTLSKV